MTCTVLNLKRNGANYVFLSGRNRWQNKLDSEDVAAISENILVVMRDRSQLHVFIRPP